MGGCYLCFLAVSLVNQATNILLININVEIFIHVQRKDTIAMNTMLNMTTVDYHYPKRQIPGGQKPWGTIESQL